MTGASPTRLSLLLPAALVRLLPGAGSAAADDERFASRTAGWPGILRLAPDLLAALPAAGDPDVVEAAIACARLLAGGGSPLLVFPGRVELAESGARLVPDDPSSDLAGPPPPFETGGIYLTSHAVLGLESACRLTPGPAFERGSGSPIPTFRVGPPHTLDAAASPGAPESPWRNEKLWDRTPPRVPRPELLTRLADPGAGSALRVTGALGSGKTRAVVEAFTDRSIPVLRAAARSVRSGAAPLAMRLLTRARQLVPSTASPLRDMLSSLLPSPDAPGAMPTPEDVAQLLVQVAAALSPTAAGRGHDPPLAVVLDDLERATADDWALASGLLAAARQNDRFRLLLVGRSGLAWPPDLAALPEVAVPLLEAASCRQLVDHLFPGLGLPEAVWERLLEAAGGNPFLLEEGLVELIRRRRIRRFYGTFVFAGTEDTGYGPSERLIRHVESESQRLGWALPLRVLALAGTAVPAGELRSAALLVGQRGAADWQAPYLGNGFLSIAESAWGPGINFTAGALRSAMAATVAPGSMDGLRHSLGQLLEARGQNGAVWPTYRLLSGSPEAVPLLLRLSESKGAHLEDGAGDEGDLIDALVHELHRHRERRGEPSLELEMLWRLLPLAHRQGRLAEVQEELDRALELAADQPRKLLGFVALQVEVDQRKGRYEEAESTLRTALENAASIDEPQKAVLLVKLGRLLVRQGRYQEASELFERLLPTLAGMGLSSLASSCHFHLGNIALAEHRLEKAFEHHGKALAERRRHRAAKPLSASLAALGAVTLAMGRYPESLSYYQKAEKVARRSGDEIEIAYALMGVGRTFSRLGSYAAASAPLRGCLALRQGRGDALGEAVARLAVAENFLELGKPREALEEARLASFRLGLLESPPQLGDAEHLLGRIHSQLRAPEEAWQHLQSALEIHREHDNRQAAAFDLGELIDLALARELESELQPLLRQLGAFLEEPHDMDLAERLDFRMYRGLDWLGRPLEGSRETLFYLERAYAVLMRKTGYLEADMRNRFLFQIPLNQAILKAASAGGLAL